MHGYVYILATGRNGTLYVGVTSDLIKRVNQHKRRETGGFTKRYNVDKLVYYEVHDQMIEAISREKRLKRWRRKWKLELIEGDNLTWRDLYPELLGTPE